ncbi:unnamed protein product [Aphanomyces euteiches]|uniref:Uncharacterized protein n=1 Tax=Aphanomyces euteiches TaxID=100861 RepID=A0A6G0XGA0_9STRA|nr:hypothetical protein Ae201684_005150 [Aphanomyces euteiches]KAH9080695.1 hypothetical protein Ae201684P_012836 [Aphanomyces euteiches]KAH9136666.1 hypothetical protein AeRB84_018308 [Aphanomyces euteiches]
MRKDDIGGAAPERASEDRMTDRRQYFKRKQREYRHRLKYQQENLLEELTRLQNKLSTVIPVTRKCDDGIPSWKEIASVLQGARKESKDEFNRLKVLVDANTLLIDEMTRFVQVYQPRPMAPLSFVHPVHQYVTLMANRNARTQAKQWLVQQLYHNTDLFFHNFPALHPSDEFVDCKAERTGRWIHTFKTCQATWPNTVEEIKQLFLHPKSQRVICGTDEFDIERDGNTILMRGICLAKWSWHILQGHFYEAGRFVAVLRSLNNDEAIQDHEDPDFYRMEWIDVRQLSSTHSVVRLLVHRTELVEDFKEYMKLMGTVVTSHDSTVIEQEVSAFEKKRQWDFQQKMKTLLSHDINRTA